MDRPLPDARRELADVEFPSATWTSFDRYDRYGAIVRAVRANKGPGRLRVLDVGDAAGHLQRFDPDLEVIGLDLHPADVRLDEAVPVQGDGTCLPFADDSFDAVTSSDVLEHIPPDRRAQFLAELRRVSSDLVVVAAPFDTPGVGGVEELVRRYAMLTLGANQPQLEEHMANGLPDLDSAVDSFVESGWNAHAAGNGNLWDWLLSMLFRFQIEARPALSPLVGGADVFYNMAFARRSDVGPWYRHVLVARSESAVVSDARTPLDAPEGASQDAGSTPVSLAVLTGCLVAGSTEVVRQDTVPRLDGLIMEVANLHSRLDGMSKQLMIAQSQLDQSVTQNRELRDRFEELFAVQMRANRPSLAVQSALGRLKRLLRR